MTRSPHINLVLEHARARAEGRTAPELKAALDQAGQMLTHMQKVFEGQIRFRERTDVVKTQQPRIQSAFTRMEQAMASIRKEQFKAGADGLEQWFNTLTDALDALKAEEDTWPIYSRSPFLNVTMRIAHGVARGTIAPEALAQALSELLAHHRSMASKIDGMVRPGREAARYAERRDEIRRHVQVIEQALAEAQTMLTAGRASSIPQGLKRACEAADALLAVQDDFQQAEDADRLRPCFRCGASNPRTGRHCTKCGGVLPPLPVEDDVAAVDVTLEEGSARPRGHVRTELTVRIEDAAFSVRDGRTTTDAFTRVLDEAAERLEKARRAFAALQMPADLPDAEREAAIAASTAMQTAFTQFEEGLHRMRAYLLDGNAATLEHGLETALSAGDTLAAFQAPGVDQIVSSPLRTLPARVGTMVVDHRENLVAPSATASDEDASRAPHGPIWKRVTDYVLHSAHLLIEAAETAGVLAGWAVGGAIGATLVAAGTGAMGVSHVKNGLREKSGEQVVEGVGGLLVGVKSGLEALTLAAGHGTGALASIAHDVHNAFTPLGIAHGAVEVALGGYRTFKGVQALDLRQVGAGALTIGLGVSVCAASLGGGLPAIAASGLLLAGRIAVEEFDKVRRQTASKPLLDTANSWRLLD